MKKIVCIILASVILTSCPIFCRAAAFAVDGTDAANSQTSGSSQDITAGSVLSSDRTIIDGVVDYFLKLSEIPRGSHNEKQISTFLFNWAKERGFNPKTDKAMNVIFDIPASEGKEKSPLTILQAHMDMVVAVDEGKTFEPVSDPISVINDGKTLKADGTSLGADNGMGIALILYLIDSCSSHGPLRIIFTTDEEEDFTGVFALTEDAVKDASYLINLDSDISSELTVSSAGCSDTVYRTTFDCKGPEFDQAYTITVSGLKGGHSGEDIHYGRLNAVKAIGAVLKDIDDAGIRYDLAYIKGGTARNVIPSSCSACIVLNNDNVDKARKVTENTLGRLQKQYAEVESSISIDTVKADMPEKVFTDDSKVTAVNFINELFDGVVSMLDHTIPESSSNIGMICFVADDDTVSTAGQTIRSSDTDKLLLIKKADMMIAQECGMKISFTDGGVAWPAKDDSRLRDLFTDSYKKETGNNLNVKKIHSALESGTFIKLNPDLDIVSIGPDVFNPHTVSEYAVLDTLPSLVHVLEDVLSVI